MDLAVPPRSLRRLAASAGREVVSVAGDDATRVTGLAYDSRAVHPGALFFCVPGATTDGHSFAAEAVRRGAAALCVEHPLRLGVPEVVVADARIAMARMSAAFFGNPGDDLVLLGVTGTNGKTTTAYLVESVLKAAGRATGLIGTIETRIAGTTRPGVRTTPESVDLQRLLWEMKGAGVDAVAMEVTSHALALHRVEALRFAAAAFTNLSQDHLDFHSDMQEYFCVKRSLFVPERAHAGAVNVDDPHGVELMASATVPCLGYGRSVDADVRATGVRSGPSGQEISVNSPAGDMTISTSLVGAFNVANCLAACAISLQAGIGPPSIVEGLAALKAVPGRFESVDAGQPFAVVVDYAHTPEALDNVLREARRMAEGRVVAVFGCGGDRDKAKRPVMGLVAARLADIVVVTSDNPRSEDPERIIEEVLEGVVEARPEGADKVLVDRREAIATALGLARPGDVVVIAGKGHETGQQFADHTIDFDDREVARAVLLDGGGPHAGTLSGSAHEAS
jgi:UDP-N-acetylmuramoyl-L-alanyl-D-glutamate--2,6-diaminopimelate ligase